MSLLDVAKDIYSEIDIFNVKNMPIQENRQSTSMEDISAAFINAPFDEKINFLKQYGNSVWVYICVYAISKAVSSIPIAVFEEGAQEGELVKIPNHPITQLLKKVNNFTTFSQLIFSTVAFLKLKGDSYWVLVAANGEPVSVTNPPIEIWIVNPDNMLVVPDTKDFIKGYVYTINGHMLPLAPSEVIHIKEFNPSNCYYGQSPIQSLTNTLISEKNAIEYNAAFYENSSIPQGVLSTDKALTEPIYKRLQGQWHQKHGGIKRSHKTAILEQGLKFNNITVSQRDADFINSRKMNREEILASYGVPPIIAGLETNNFATAEQQRLVYWEETILPTSKIIVDHLQEFLVPLYLDGDNIKIKPELSESPAFKMYQKENEERARGLWNDQLITKNEARTKFLNMDDVGKDGDLFKQDNQLDKEDNSKEPKKDEEDDKKKWVELFEGQTDWE